MAAKWADTAHEMELVRKLGTLPPNATLDHCNCLCYSSARSWQATRSLRCGIVHLSHS